MEAVTSLLAPFTPMLRIAEQELGRRVQASLHEWAKNGNRQPTFLYLGALESSTLDSIAAGRPNYGGRDVDSTDRRVRQYHGLRVVSVDEHSFLEVG